MGLPIAFEFYQTRNSKCGYFAWVVRLLLMTPDVSNYEIYIHQISTFLTGSKNVSMQTTKHSSTV